MVQVRVVSLFAVGVFAGGAVAQCATAFQAMGGFGGTNAGIDRSVVWDPDGAGPAAPLAVFCGQFTVAGPHAVAGVAAWDPGTDTWLPFAPSPDRAICLTVDGSGALVVGRHGSSGDRIERWTGSGWQSIGTVSGSLSGLATVNGTLVHTTYIGAPLMVWNGSTWLPLAAPSPIAALAVGPNGDLVVAASPSGFTGGTVWRLSAGTWTQLGGNGAWFDLSITAMAFTANGDLVVSGPFNNLGSVPMAKIARWDGVAWSSLGVGMNGHANTMLGLGNGDLLVGGAFTSAGGVPVDQLARWNGTAWSALPPITSAGYPIQPTGLCALPSGLVVAGYALQPTPANVLLLQGATWSTTARGADMVDGPVHASTALGGADHAIGGAFTHVGVVPCQNIARCVGGAWSALGTGVNGVVRAMATLPNGDLVAAGSFTVAGGVPANGIARWSGGAWQAMPGLMQAPVRALLALPNGDLVASDAYRIARWSAGSWTTLGPVSSFPMFGIDYTARVLTTDAQGDLVAAGLVPVNATTFNYGIARWNGAGWQLLSPIGWDPSNVVRLANGDLIADQRVSFGMGFFEQLQRWDGVSWNAYGPTGGLVMFSDLAPVLALPDGDVAVSVSIGSPGPQLLRVASTGSAPLAGTVDGLVRTATMLANGTVVFGGDFTQAGAGPASHYARLASSCPAIASAAGAGCASSAGPVTLTATSLPWLGGQFVGEVAGLPANALGLAVTSAVPTTVPLSLVLPVAGAGCDGLVSVLLSDLVVPSNGRARTGFAVPDVPALVGLSLFHYVASIEFGANGAVVGLAASDRLALVLGVL